MLICDHKRNIEKNWGVIYEYIKIKGIRMYMYTHIILSYMTHSAL